MAGCTEVICGAHGRRKTGRRDLRGAAGAGMNEARNPRDGV